MEKLIEEDEKNYFEIQEERYEYGKEEVDALEDVYITAKETEATAKVIVAEKKLELEQFYAQGFEPRKINRTEMKRKGNVDMKELQRKHNLMDSDIDECRKPEINIITYKVK